MKKIFRKIHLWLSIPFGIFITLICFSGAMLVFEKEVTEWCRPDIYLVKEVQDRPLPLDSLMEKVSRTLPDTVDVTGVTVSPDARRTWQVSLSQPRRASLYVNPYTGEVTGRSERLPFYDTMFHLHRWLMGSSSGFGKLLVGISTLLLVIILLTGILMWLTNRKKPLKKSLTISFTKGWPRFWHDLHVAGGIYATVFLLALALTGLTWSFSWYRTGFYGMFGVEASAGGHGGHGGGHEGNREGGKGREGRHGRPDGKRHGHDEARAGQDSLRADEAEDRGQGRRSAEGAERHRGHAAEEPAGQSAAAQEATADATEKPASGNDAQAEQAEPTEHPHGEGQWDGEHRGRHGGRGGYGRYHHHDGDSTRRHAGRHRADSLQSLAENGGADGEADAEAGQAARHRRPEQPATAASATKATGRHGQGGRKGHSASKQAAKADMRRDTLRAERHDSVAIAELPQLSPFAHWQEVYEKLAAAHPGYRQITLQDGSASVVPAGRNSLRSGDRFDFDPASGSITGSQPYAEQDKAAHVRSAVYTLHTGSWGGMLTRILTFLAALLGATLPLTGYYLWIRKLRNKSAHKRPQP